jgi:UDP-glucuronate 4-epimerase
MAVFKFAEAIRSGTPLPFYRSEVPVGRDFTYVTDIVNGVLLALEHFPTRCAEVYNLGFGQTVTLDYLLQLLEKELGMTAKVVSLFLSDSFCFCVSVSLKCVFLHVRVCSETSLEWIQQICPCYRGFPY